MLTPAEYQQLRDEIERLRTELAQARSIPVLPHNCHIGGMGLHIFPHDGNHGCVVCELEKACAELAQSRAWSAAWKERAKFYRELCSEPDETELYIIDNLRAELAQERADTGAIEAQLRTELSRAHTDIARKDAALRELHNRSVAIFGADNGWTAKYVDAALSPLPDERKE